MSCIYYNTISQYIESKSSLLERIQAIDLLIDAMIASLADVVVGQNVSVEEYSLDDGQMVVKTKYRSVQDVEAGIQALERSKQRYINRFNGRVSVLRDVRGIDRRPGRLNRY